MTVWVKVNASVCAWLEFMSLQMSKQVSKRSTVMCGCVKWVRLVSACSFPAPRCIDGAYVSCKHFIVFATFEKHILNERSKVSSWFIWEIKDLLHYLQKEDEKNGRGKRRGVSHSGHPRDGSRLPWFQSSCGWCCWADGRQAAGCLTAADGATQVSKNTQALSLAYMCHIIPVIILLSTHSAHTHRQTPDCSMGSHDWL